MDDNKKLNLPYGWAFLFALPASLKGGHQRTIICSVNKTAFKIPQAVVDAAIRKTQVSQKLLSSMNPLNRNIFLFQRIVNFRGKFCRLFTIPMKADSFSNNGNLFS